MNRTSLILSAAVVGAMWSFAGAQSGTWNTDVPGVNDNWSETTNWLDGIVADGAENTATFDFAITAPRNITLDSSRTIGGLTFGVSGGAGPAWSLTGGNTLTLAHTSGFATLNTLTDASIAVQLSGASGLTKIGNGTLTLSNGSNDYAGGTNIDAGRIVITNSGALGASGTINLGAASGSANSSLLLDNAISFGRAITVQAGSTGTRTFGGNNTTGTVTYTGAISLNADLVVSQAAGGTLLFSTAATFSGTGNTTFAPAAGGLIQFADSGNGGSGWGGAGSTITLNGAGTLQLSNAATSVLGNASTKLVLTNGRLRPRQGASINLNNPTEINGNVSIGREAAQSDKRSVNFLNASVTTKFNGASPMTIGISTDTGRNVTFGGAGAQFDQNVTFNAEASGSRLTFINNTTITGNRTIALNTGLSAGFNGALVGAGFDLTLQGNSTTVFFGNGGALPAGPVTGASSPRIVIDGPTVDFSNTTSTFAGGVKTLSGTLRISAGGTSLGSGGVTFSGGNISNSGVSNGGSGPVSVNTNYTFDGGTTGVALNGNGGANLTLNGNGSFVNNPTIDQSGANSLILNNLTPNSNATIAGTGSLSINNLTLAANRTITFNGTGAKTIAGAMSGAFTLDIAGSSNNVNFGLLTGSGVTLNINDAAVRVFANNAASTFTGSVKLSAGTLVIASSGGLGTGTLELAGGTINSNNAVNTTANPISITGSFTIADNNSQAQIYSGAVDVSGSPTITSTAVANITFSNAITLNSDVTFNPVSNNGINFTGSFVLPGARTVSNISANNITLAAPITGPGSLTKDGTGLVTLTGASTYAGSTTVTTGTLRLNGASDRLPATSVVTVGAAGTLEPYGNSTFGTRQQTIGGLAGTGIVTNSNSGGNFGDNVATLVIDGGNSAVWSGTIQNSNGLAVVKQGAGTQTFASANTYTLGTTISGGTLVITNASGSATGSGAISLGAATLAGTGIASGVVTSTGGTIAPGLSAGTITFGGLVLNAGSVLNFELDAIAASDKIVLGGGTFNAAGATTLNLTDLGGLVAGNYTLATYGAFAGSLANIAYPGTLSGKSLLLVDTGTTLQLQVTGGGPAQWNNPAGGTYNLAGNWTGGVPDAVGAVANFLAVGATSPITVDTAVTVGTINLNNAAAYTINGPQGITLSVSSGNAAVNVIAGNHAVNAQLTLASNTDVAVASGLTLTTGTIAGPFALNATGTGTLAAGKLDVGVLSIAAGGTVQLRDSNAGAIEGDVNGAGFNGGNGGTIGAGSTSVITGLSLAGTSTLDIRNNDLIVRAAATDIDTVRGQVNAAYNGGLWDLAGLTSSRAAGDGLAVGYGSNLDLGYTVFSGVAVGTDDFMVKYTWFGDANLDGQVDGDDYLLWLAVFGSSGSGIGWGQGDFDYDQDVDGDDYLLWLQNFGNGIGSPLAAVPEPGLMGLAAVAGAGLLARRRRSAR